MELQFVQFLSSFISVFPNRDRIDCCDRTCKPLGRSDSIWCWNSALPSWKNEFNSTTAASRSRLQDFFFLLLLHPITFMLEDVKQPPRALYVSLRMKTAPAGEHKRTTRERARKIKRKTFRQLSKPLNRNTTIVIRIESASSCSWLLREVSKRRETNLR